MALPVAPMALPAADDDNVKVFTYHDSPRRAHSIAAQGGVNSSRSKKVDNDSAYRHAKDTVKGGD